ncbi:MAG TPA: hypothetical protein PLR88_05505 [Bacteroidales bacterium]|nr:hypothetical protein [Bacteroidales bacterium]
MLSLCSLALFLTSCNSFICKNAINKSVGRQDIIEDFFDTLNVRKFKTGIHYGSNEITGIIIYKKLNDSIYAGSFINEFGIRGFDFKLSGNRVGMENMIKNIDKWYIRKKLENDLHFLFSRPEMISPCSIDKTPVYVSTVNRSLHYVYYTDGKMWTGKADMYKHSDKVAEMNQYADKSSRLVIKMRHINCKLTYDLSEITP